MTGMYAYEWTVDGYLVMTPDPNTNPEPQFIDMPRGCVPGTAQLYLRAEDAKKVIDKASVTIVAKIFRRNDSDTDAAWTLAETLQWKEYIPIEIMEPDDKAIALVTLKDKRHRIDRQIKAKIWNQVRYVTAPASGVETITYEPLYLNSGVKFTYQQIVDDLLGGVAAPSLPAKGGNFPQNLFCTGSSAQYLDAVLASLGYALTIKRDGSFSYVDVGTQTLPSKVQQARKEQLVAREDTKTKRHGKIVMWPNKYYPAHPKSSTETFGAAEDVEEVLILDSEIADKNNGMVAARKADIKTVVEAWHQAERNDFDETFYGLLDVTPGVGIYQVTWNLGVAGKGHSTRVRNFSPPMLWPQKCNVPCPTPLWGKTAASIAADSTGEAYIDDPISSSPFWTTSGKRQLVYNRGGVIAADKRVLIFPIDDRWCAVEVC